MPGICNIRKSLLLNRCNSQFVVIGVCEVGDSPVTIGDCFKCQMLGFMVSKPPKIRLVDNKILDSIAAD